MVLGRTHPGVLGLLWLADLMLFPALIPANADARDLLIAAGLWMVPTILLVVATWRWRKHTRA